MVLRIRVRGTSSKSTEDRRPKTEDETPAGEAGPAASAASISRLMMRPPGPLPETPARLMPRSSARRFASGLERERPPLAAGADDAAGGRARDRGGGDGETRGGARGGGARAP